MLLTGDFHLIFLGERRRFSFLNDNLLSSTSVFLLQGTRRSKFASPSSQFIKVNEKMIFTVNLDPIEIKNEKS